MLGSSPTYAARLGFTIPGFTTKLGLALPLLAIKRVSTIDMHVSHYTPINRILIDL
jgi:hypothetical protein